MISEKMFLRFISGAIIFSILYFLFCDFAYTYNWLGVNDIVFKKYSKILAKEEFYSLGELLSCSDNYFLVAVLLIPAWMVVRPVRFMPYIIALLFDFLLIGILFCFISNPYEANWDKTLWVIISFSIFILKIFLQLFYPNFKKLNIFSIPEVDDYKIIRFNGKHRR